MSHPQDNKSTHLPEVSGNIVDVTGTLVVDTGLREVQSIVAALHQDAVAGAAGVSIETAAVAAGGTVQATISVWEDDGTTASTAAASVSWLALGK